SPIPNPPPPMPHPAALPPDELLRACRFQTGRRSGPGGQHRNKVETAVVYLHEPTGIRAEATERRSQAANRQVALFRLRVNLALEVRGQAALADLPSALWQSRCGPGGRIAISAEHDDFPALLAEALDALALCDDEPARAAAVLGCTSSQLIRLLKKEPRGLAWLNARRQSRGLGTLR
ncbi:MAG: peptide chain release factor-like protein, partial [Pirellulales bacterium]|nr:peptide chain release factor-like protein [Pirellulales bacterium]